MSRKAEELALRKELLRLRLEANRLEIQAGVSMLRSPLRNVAIGASVLKLLRSHPILVTSIGALVARTPKLAFIARLGAACLAVWQAARLYRFWRRS